ncbi:hypothetical protein GIB67_010751, partial [Kingdonia uniflora]
NDLGDGSAEEALGAQRTKGDAMNEDNDEAPPMSEEPQTKVSQEEIAVPIDDTYLPDRSFLLSFKFHRARSIYLKQEPSCLRVHHHAPTWHLDKEATIVHDLVMLASLDMISLSVDGDVPITEGSWPLPKLVEIFKRNLYQDVDFFNSIKIGGQGNSLSLVKLLNFYAGKLEKYNDSIQNERPNGQKKKKKKKKKKKNKAISALSVARTYMLFAVLAHLFHNLSTASRTDGKQFAAYTTLLEATECKQLKDENKALVEHISALKEEVQKMKDQKKQENEKETYEMITEKLTEKTKECQVLKVENTKLVEDMRIKTGVDASNASLEIELAKQLAVIPKGEAVSSRDLQKKIDKLTVKYEEVVKRLKEKESLEAWRQAIKNEFHSRELVEKDNPTFIKLFDQYDRFYTITQQGPKGDYQEDFTVTGENQDKLMDVRRENVVLKKKINETLFQLYVKYHLDVRGVQGEDGNSAFRVPAIIKHQSQNKFKKVMNSLESLLTKDPAFWKTIFNQSLDTHFSS